MMICVDSVLNLFVTLFHIWNVLYVDIFLETFWFNLTCNINVHFYFYKTNIYFLVSLDSQFNKEYTFKYKQLLNWSRAMSCLHPGVSDHHLRWWPWRRTVTKHFKCYVASTTGQRQTTSVHSKRRLEKNLWKRWTSGRWTTNCHLVEVTDWRRCPTWTSWSWVDTTRSNDIDPDLIQ